VNPHVDLPVGNVAQPDLRFEEPLRVQVDAAENAAAEVGLAVVLEIEPVQRDATADVRPELGAGLELVMQIQIPPRSS
jgi:hypothetical protein